ncbi:MAG: coat protein [Cressdnaviricota sp.]|nr:MAG: coat protein [Cressdnaviricota sp.]
MPRANAYRQGNNPYYDVDYGPPVKRKPRKKAAPKAVRKAKAPTGARPSTIGKNIRAGGASLGQFLGSGLAGPAGGVAGSMLGKAGGAMISKLFGHGDYSVSNADALKENSIALSNAAQMPQFGTGKVACNFTHREFLGDVISASTASTFKIDSYPINPGLSTTFPWLSGVVGAKFQQYRINGCCFEFRSMSGDSLTASNTALGSVIMSTDYDSADATFSSKQEMENTEYGVSCKPSVNMIHGIECARAQTPVSELYIRAFDVPSGKDIRLYDLGRFSIASTGCQGTNVNLGELWISYSVDVFKAVEQVPGYLIPFSQYALVGTLPASAPLGTSQPQLLTQAANSINLTFSANKISWPIDVQVGSIYHVSLNWDRASSAVTAPVITTGNGMYVNSNTVWYPATGTTTATFSINMDVQYQGGATPAALPYLNIANFTYAGANVQSDLYVYQMSGLFPGTYTSQTG